MSNPPDQETEPMHEESLGEKCSARSKDASCITTIDVNVMPALGADDHVLTYAEWGFAPLTIHGEKLGIEHEDLEGLANTVNHFQAVGTMYPRAPISAIPRRAIRREIPLRGMADLIGAWLHLNSVTPMGTNLYIDFGCPNNPRHLRAAVEKALLDYGTCGIQNIYIVER